MRAAVEARYAAARAWRPGAGVRATGWLPPRPPASEHPRYDALVLAAYELYDQLNAQHFAGVCPPATIGANPRLRRALARALPAVRLIELNPRCLTVQPDLLADLVYHEMVHLWLFTRGRPAGHTPEFRAKLAARPADVAPADITYRPHHHLRHTYACPACGLTFTRRRRYSRPAYCAPCHHAGRGAHEVQLLGTERV